MAELTIDINTGPICRHNSVVRVPVGEDVLKLGDHFTLNCESCEVALPAQIDKEERELVFVLPDAPPEQMCTLTLTPAEKGESRAVADAGGEQIDISLDGALFAEYHFPSEDFGKPYVAPIIGPYGDRITREISPDITEHPHHRGLFIAHGEINGEEVWNEPKSGEHGATHQKDIRSTSGSIFAKLLADLTWVNRDEQPLMDETRSYWFYALPREARLIDLKLSFKAAYGDVELGATKEAGFLGIRVHPDMNGNAGKGGRMENAYGGIGEAQCWSKKAHWCDYHGIVNGNRVGIAALDHPGNLRFPTGWHIRDYGLFAANCWFWDGPYTIRAGHTLTLNYRLIVHAGDTRAANIAARFVDYDIPVRAAVCEEE